MSSDHQNVDLIGSDPILIDPHKYYDLERYLLEDVQPRFQEEGSIGAFDFFSIVIWKANRAKSKIAAKLKDGPSDSDLEKLCRKLSAAIWTAADEKAKMRVLIHD